GAPRREAQPMTGRPRPPSTWDRAARGAALLLLVVILTAAYWVPFGLVGPIGAAAVCAVLTLGLLSIGFQLRQLRYRVRDLEARSALATEPPSPEPVVSPSDPP